jgi:hypothetical protein
VKRYRHLLRFILLISLIGASALTASDYADCKDLLPDEFLDLALAPRHLIFPIFALFGRRFFSLSENIVFPHLAHFLTTILRC